ncbi:MAG: rhomboid family intramembrane serine protease [Acidobacteria bacterium]|nr:rhomboid family intramembrane serine protease [Acidobacteriota bacterium]
MSRFSPQGTSVQFGPGPITPAVRAIIIANVALFVPSFFLPVVMQQYFGLVPELLLTKGWLWQLATYAFVHADITHVLFNMLIVWMFGVELERRWGSVAFTKFYFVCAIGAAFTVLGVSLLPFDDAHRMYVASTIGASGACYGLLMAWALLFPTREILLFFVFPVQARYAVLIFGALAFFSGLGSGGGTVAHFAHLGGLVVGYLYLKGPRGMRFSLQSAITRWRFARLKKKFKVHDGGQSGRGGTGHSGGGWVH